MAPGTDGGGLFAYPMFVTAATNRSHDNDNSAPVENEIDEANAGTSFSAGFATAAGAIIRDYFAQGFYPTGTRVQADRMPIVSGSLVRAGLVASANFMEYLVLDIPSPIPNASDQTLFFSRGTNLGTVGVVPVGVIGNNVQGYGRVVISNLLPISAYPPTIGMGSPDSLEYPAAGLLVYDMLGTGEAPINNVGNTQTEKTFTVDGVNAVTLAGGTRAIKDGQLRIAVSWPDPPSAVSSGGTIVNDLDLEVESPGNDNCLTPADTKPDGTACPGTAANDNRVYDGNVYIAGLGLPAGQWAQSRAIGDPDVRDVRNNIEAVHLSSFASETIGNQLPTGTWRVRVKRGTGGALPGQISGIIGANEDNVIINGRFDPGEADTDGDGLLDAGGQPFSLVIAGPVFGSGSQTWGGQSHSLPASSARLDKYQYSCADDLVATVVDAGATAAGVFSNVAFQVVDAAGAVLDQENGFVFSETATNSHVFRSVSIPTRLASPPATGAVKYDGVLEGDNGQSIVMTYTDAPRSSVARARFQCTPDVQTAQIDYTGRRDPAAVVTGGCDGDTYLDSGEHVQFSIALRNFEKADDLTDVEANLTATGTGAGAVLCLDCPKNIGRIPGGQTTGITFALRVDPAAAAGLVAAPINLTLTLDGKARGVRTSRVQHTFPAVINADKQALHYSTDFPNGGRQVRDFNRNIQIDRPDLFDPFKGVFWPDEDITFSTMFVANSAKFCSNNPGQSCTVNANCPPGGTCVGGFISNTLGEDLDNSGKACSHNFGLPCTTDANCASTCVANVCTNSNPAVPCVNNSQCVFTCLTFTGAERDIVPNTVLDRGILLSNAPGDVHRVPFNFDRNNGGWLGLRHPDSKATGVPAVNMWEYKTTGACGFQTAINDLNASPLFQATGAGGIWHTGDTNPATPSGQVCDSYPYPNSLATPMFEEIVFDILVSPIIAKVNQLPDANSFPYTVEFQRLGMNINMQTEDYAGGDIDFDSDVDRDQGNCLMCQYWYYRFGDIYTLTALESYAYGINPVSDFPQRTFGQLTDPNGSLGPGNPQVSGDETGFTGFTQNTNLKSSSPIPPAKSDFLPFPALGAPVACVPGCVDPNPNPPDECCEQNTVEGPERNMDLVLLEYDDGFIYTSLGPGGAGPTGGFDPGPAGNRWQIGIGFWVWENPAGKTDYGLGVDDVVLEWDEVHPVAEPGGSPACSRFGGAGQPGGQQCATLTVDRLYIYECNETVGITVDDPRRAGAGSVIVRGVTDTDNTPLSTGTVVAKHPVKDFTIPEVSPGLFKGNVTVGTLFNHSGVLFSNPAADTSMTFYYIDPECDGDGDGIIGETSFVNLDNDGIAAATDNCDFLYNPLQEDADADLVGNLCDNCPGVPNSDQRDSDADTVGDECDFDDVDFDGVVNDIDNCPDVYNPLQVAGVQGRGTACDLTSQDVDADGVADRSDNCVRTSNPSPQVDSDNDNIGNACDGDCGNAQKVLLANGSCSRSSHISCTSNAQCPTTGHCSIRVTRPCTVNQDCSGGGGGQEICINILPETCQRFGVSNNGTCPAVGDDMDGDQIPDPIDNCPTVPNPTILPGAVVQPDVDSDGRGDACDPPQTVDDDNNGIPDDAVTFNTIVACKRLPLASLVVLAKDVADVPPNGDNDVFADAGETARMSIVVRNTSGFALTNATLVLSTIDPDIACITKPTVLIGTLADGAVLDTASLGNAGRFEFVVSQATSTTNPTNPATIDFLVSVVSAQAVGTTAPVPVTALADLDLPGGGLPAKVAGPDGIPGNADDGLIFEDFDTERDGFPQIALSNLQRGTPGVQNDTIGVWVGTAPGGINTLAGIGCAGFNVPPADPECRIEPDNDMDWHIHCPAGSCPNGQGHVTPTPEGPLAFSGQNSLHWGHHFDTTSRSGDSVKFRQLAAFMTDPINLTPVPGVGDLELSFYHVADQMDNNTYNLPPGQANDYGDIHIQVFDANAPGGGQWGFWDRLQPYQNVYDHIAYIWSTFGTGTTYCLLTPTDTGTGGYAPRGVKETMCYPNGIWSHCGNSRDESTTWQCGDADDQGHVGATGTTGPGLWMQSKFSLANYLGQTVRIRWIAQSWEFDCCSSSYYEVGGTWFDQPGDEGWWVDDIRITGALTAPAAPSADTQTPFSGACPANGCNNTVGDSGFNIDLTVTDSDGNGLIVAGEKILLSAAGTTNPGGCVGGGPQFRFFKDGTAPANVVQDWSSDPTFIDNPVADAVYRVQVRCSTAFAPPNGCLSNLASAAAMESIYVCQGSGCDIVLTLTNTRGRCFTAASPTGTNTGDLSTFCNADSECGAGAFCGVGVCTAGSVPPNSSCNVGTNCGTAGACNATSGAQVRTTISFLSRPQPVQHSGYDAYFGPIASSGDPSQGSLTGIACMTGGHIAQPPGAPGQTINLTDSFNPGLNQGRYFLVGPNPVNASEQVLLGRRSNGVLRPLQPVCP
jgi:hypothetical protein